MKCPRKGKGKVGKGGKDGKGGSKVKQRDYSDYTTDYTIPKHDRWDEPSEQPTYYGGWKAGSWGKAGSSWKSDTWNTGGGDKRRGHYDCPPQFLTKKPKYDDWQDQWSKHDRNRQGNWNWQDEQGWQDEPGGFTGPQAQDANYTPAPEPNKVPQGFKTKDDVQAAPDFWGGKATYTLSMPCDDCKLFYTIAHALILVDKDGNVVNTIGGANMRVQEWSNYLEELHQHLYDKKAGEHDPDEDEGNESFEKAKKSCRALQNKDVQNLCFRCYGKKFKDNEDWAISTKNGGMSLTSGWFNLQKKRRGENKKEDCIMEYKWSQAVKWMEEAGATDAQWIDMERTYEAIKKKPIVLAAADWNPIVGPGVILVFRCPDCHIAPVRLEKWMKMVSPGSDEYATGLTQQGGSKSHWRCAAKYVKGACLYKWTDSTGVGRVLVLTELSDMTCGQEYECLFLGNISKENDHIIGMFRAATLLKKAQWDTAKKSLLNAIHELNNDCEQQLIHLAECRNIRSCTMDDVEIKCSYKPYCEDKRLSIESGGEIYKALYLPPETPVISEERLDRLLCIMAMYVDWNAVKPKNAGEAKNAWYKINEQIEKNR